MYVVMRLRTSPFAYVCRDELVYVAMPKCNLCDGCLQYIGFAVLMSMVSISVYLQIGFTTKILLLCGMDSVFFVIVLGTHENLFDNRDFLLYTYHE